MTRYCQGCGKLITAADDRCCGCKEGGAYILTDREGYTFREGISGLPVRNDMHPHKVIIEKLKADVMSRDETIKILERRNSQLTTELLTLKDLIVHLFREVLDRAR